MSFEILWEAVDAQLAATVCEFLNKRLAAVPDRPAVLGPVLLRDLSFGSVPPVVTIVDLASPREAFYVRRAEGQGMFGMEWEIIE